MEIFNLLIMLAGVLVVAFALTWMLNPTATPKEIKGSMNEMKYFIFYQVYDDAAYFSSNTIEGINEFMEKHNLSKDTVWLIKGEMVSTMFNSNWPKK